MRLIRDEYNELHPVKAFAWFMVVLLLAPIVFNYLMVGREVTVTGTVQLHTLSDDWIIGKNTDLELRTYSGDTHHVEVLGHHHFELYKAYKITFKWVVLWGGCVRTGKLVEAEEITVS